MPDLLIRLEHSAHPISGSAVEPCGWEPEDFFVSHAREDRAWAEWVAWQLEQAGYSVELDVWDWAVGRNFVTAMSDALDRCDRVVALVSSAYFDRFRYTTEEWSAAVVHVLGLGEDRLVPVRVEEVPPGEMPAVLELGRRLEAGPVAVVAVRGLGGVGKSQLALEYAYRMCEAGRYELVGWVRADSAVTVAEDLAAMAPPLGIDADRPAGELAAAVVAALGGRRDWLVVFDNAQAPADLAGMVPGGGGHVLITSRTRQWGRIAAQLNLEEFTRAESVAFLPAVRA
jgi:hypothetical protein